jgi:hypothetical protein
MQYVKEDAMRYGGEKLGDVGLDNIAPLIPFRGSLSDKLPCAARRRVRALSDPA